MTDPLVFGVTGWKNSGKTTLVCELVSEITNRGFSVSTLKHAHDSFEIDHEGRDSYRHRASGASEVLVSSKVRWAIVHELRGEKEPPLKAMLARLSPVDLVIVEGYKREPHDKIECRRSKARSSEEIATNDPSIVAIASDISVKTALPNFNLDDITAIADFVLAHVGLISSDVVDKVS